MASQENLSLSWILEWADDVETFFKKRRWRWIGHTLRKPFPSTSRQALTWNQRGKRKRGWLRNTWRRDLKADINKMRHTWKQLESMAEDSRKKILLLAQSVKWRCAQTIREQRPACFRLQLWLTYSVRDLKSRLFFWVCLVSQGSRDLAEMTVAVLHSACFLCRSMIYGRCSDFICGMHTAEFLAWYVKRAQKNLDIRTRVGQNPSN